MAQNHPKRETPFPPRSGYLLPIVSLALSLPTLVGAIAVSGVALYHGLTGHVLDLSAPPLVQTSVGFAIVVCYIVFGPMLGCILCVTQRARTEQIYGSVLLLGYSMKRLNTLAVWSAALATVALLLVVTVGMLLRSGT